MATSLRHIKQLNLLLLFIAINIIAIDGFIVWQYMQKRNVLGDTTTIACPQACINRINALSGSTSPAIAKEYFIPLGSGSGISTEWNDVGGANAYIDARAYTRIKKVTFETTLYQPSSSQRVWVRLVNATDGRVLSNSELSTDSSGPLSLISPAISLDYGNKLYQVQIKTQLGGLTNLTQARIHILTY